MAYFLYIIFSLPPFSIKLGICNLSFANPFPLCYAWTMKTGHPLHVAAFVTPHGFGHAARASAMLAEIRRQVPDLRIEIFTTVPEWFFRESLSGEFEYHSVLTDIGLVQKSPLEEDLEATLNALGRFLPFDTDRLAPICTALKEKRCNLALCDISPLGIAAAKSCAIPSVLVENFTWDRIYSAYLPQEPRFAGAADYLEEIFQKADLHIQTEPCCRGSFAPEKPVRPIARKKRTEKSAIRKSLGAARDQKILLITMGGIEARLPFLEKLKTRKDLFFIIPGRRNGAASETGKEEENLLLLPHRSKYFHPDLIHAADAVVGKAGYSTIAEVWAAGIPFGYVPRNSFPETEGLIRFITSHLSGMAIEPKTFENGEWIEAIDALLSLPATPPKDSDGASEAAARILDFIAI